MKDTDKDENDEGLITINDTFVWTELPEEY